VKLKRSSSAQVYLNPAAKIKSVEDGDGKPRGRELGGELGKLQMRNSAIRRHASLYLRLSFPRHRNPSVVFEYFLKGIIHALVLTLKLCTAVEEQ